MQESYNEMFTRKYRKCHSKKDYKKLCKEMIRQLTLIDKIDENLWKIFASTCGEDVYPKALAAAIQMYLLEQQGISCDILTYEVVTPNDPGNRYDI